MGGFYECILDSNPNCLNKIWFIRCSEQGSIKACQLFCPISRSRVAFGVYQITTVLTLLNLFFLKVRVQTKWFYVGLIILIAGSIIYIISIVNFAKPKISGINLKGLYQVSRNSMYIGYFIYFLGCAIITYSWTLFIVLVIFQISAHWIILSEERWCLEKFGSEYRDYMNNVRRYI